MVGVKRTLNNPLNVLKDIDGKCCGAVAWCLEDGSMHVFHSHVTILATGGYGRAFLSSTSAYICTGDGNAMILRKVIKSYL